MALACNPKLLIADEPTTALDVTIQAQILQLMLDLKRRVGAAIVLITHDLGVVAEVAAPWWPLYAGRKVEEAPVAELFRSPVIPITRACWARCPTWYSLFQAQRGGSPDPQPGAQPQGPDRGLVACRAMFAGDRSLPAGCPGPRREGTPPHRRLPLRAQAGGRGMSRPLLQVNDLKKHFPVRGGLFSRKSNWVYAVDGVLFDVDQGQTLALVGESGCGRSTVGRAILGLFDITAGQVMLDGQRIDDLTWGTAAAPPRPGHAPGSVLQSQSADARARRSGRTDAQIRTRQILPPKARGQGGSADGQGALPSDALNRRPHECSGGQRQRIGIARALAAEPELIVCDEAVSALDVSVKAQIVNLLQDLQRQVGSRCSSSAMILAIVEHMTHRVAVIIWARSSRWRGGCRSSPHRGIPTRRRCCRPCRCPARGNSQSDHPEGRRAKPDQSAPASGCRFHTRCPYVFDRCRTGAGASVDRWRTMGGVSSRRAAGSAGSRSLMLCRG